LCAQVPRGRKEARGTPRTRRGNCNSPGIEVQPVHHRSTTAQPVQPVHYRPTTAPTGPSFCFEAVQGRYRPGYSDSFSMTGTTGPTSGTTALQRPGRLQEVVQPPKRYNRCCDRYNRPHLRSHDSCTPHLPLGLYILVPHFVSRVSNGLAHRLVEHCSFHILLLGDCDLHV
jgi:hypothetical protein